MDSFGHVNNARYLTFFEEGRIGYLNELVGWNYDWSKNGVILASASVDFKLPTHFRDEVYMYVHCSKVGTKSFTLEYEMVKKVDELEIILATGSTVQVMYDYDKGKSVVIPDEWKNKLNRN